MTVTNLFHLVIDHCCYLNFEGSKPWVSCLGTDQIVSCHVYVVVKTYRAPTAFTRPNSPFFFALLSEVDSVSPDGAHNC